jgi:hypothetical protein
MPIFLTGICFGTTFILDKLRCQNFKAFSISDKEITQTACVSELSDTNRTARYQQNYQIPTELSDTNTQMFIKQINIIWQKGHLLATCYQLQSTTTQ